MRRGPKGAAIETQLEVTATRTWRFGPDVIRKRLGLPEDARLFVVIPGWESSAGKVELAEATIGDDTPLTAVATETRKPAVKP